MRGPSRPPTVRGDAAAVGPGVGLRRATGPAGRAVWAILAGYAAALAVIAFWPTHVDRDAGPLVDALLRVVPWLSYGGLEFAANVVLFVPLGALGAAVLRPAAVVPFVGLIVSATIETVQSDFLVGRTGSVGDIIANALGATVGTAVVIVARRRSTAARSRR